MARPLRIQHLGAFYHVTSRGNERKAIFRTDRDRKRFLSYLQSAHERYGAILHVYCLMSNHYHLLLETPRGNLEDSSERYGGPFDVVCDCFDSCSPGYFHMLDPASFVSQESEAGGI